jgi:16S rRNA processing protein RimM
MASDTFPPDAVEVARILGAWGVKGWVKIQPYAEDPQALFSSKRWYVKAPEGPFAIPGAPPLPPLLKVIQAKEHGDGVVAGLQDVASRDAAEALRGARIFVPRSSFPTASSDEFYWVDLIGLSVFNQDNIPLGTVVGLLETGAHCVLRIQPPAPDAAAQAGSGAGRAAAQAPELLIPFVDAYVGRVDLAGRRIEVEWSLDWGLDT